MSEEETYECGGIDIDVRIEDWGELTSDFLAEFSTVFDLELSEEDYELAEDIVEHYFG